MFIISWFNIFCCKLQLYSLHNLCSTPVSCDNYYFFFWHTKNSKCIIENFKLHFLKIMNVFFLECDLWFPITQMFLTINKFVWRKSRALYKMTMNICENINILGFCIEHQCISIQPKNLNPIQFNPRIQFNSRCIQYHSIFSFEWN